MAQLRELARTTGLARTYSRLSRSQLIEALQQVLPEQSGSVINGEPSVPLAAMADRGSMVAAADPVDVSQVGFLPRDPQWAYVFWNVSSADQQRAMAAGAQQLCLRVADVTGLPFGVSHPHTMQEVVVDASGREWHLPVPMSDRDYRVELGYRLAAGGWLSLSFSSVARMPAAAPGGMVADLFLPFSLDAPSSARAMAPAAVSRGGVEHEQMYQRSTAASPRRLGMGSEVFQEGRYGLAGQDLLNASGAGAWPSGRSESGSGMVHPRSFWLVADAELIVYGATDPSASLFIGDQPVPLKADGSFRVHVPFGDGEQVYPIRAVAADGEQERWIELDFQRRTPQSRVNRAEEAVLEWF